MTAAMRALIAALEEERATVALRCERIRALEEAGRLDDSGFNYLDGKVAGLDLALSLARRHAS